MAPAIGYRHCLIFCEHVLEDTRGARITLARYVSHIFLPLENPEKTPDLLVKPRAG
jgi:hypothetical protein